MMERFGGRQSLLPGVLSLEELRQMIELTDNIKHKCIIRLLHSGELLLEVRRPARGIRNAMLGLLRHLLALFGVYCKAYQPKDWFIETERVIHGLRNPPYRAT